LTGSVTLSRRRIDKVTDPVKKPTEWTSRSEITVCDTSVVKGEGEVGKGVGKFWGSCWWIWNGLVVTTAIDSLGWRSRIHWPAL
jgi:hypothetical protein